MGRKPDTLRPLGWTRQEWNDALELAYVPKAEFEAAIERAEAKCQARGRHLSENAVFHELGIGRERRRQNVGSADDIPENVLAWAAELSPEERRMFERALKLTQPKEK